MDCIPRSAAVCVLLTITGFGQQTGPTAQEVSEFESFATQPISRVTWFEEIGRIDSPEAQARVTAIAVSGSSPSREIRGVRVDFARGATKDRIYIEQRFVKGLIGALTEIDELSPRYFATRVGQSSCFGSGMFLHAMRSGAHFFHASSCQDMDGFTGLSVGTGTQTFRFATADLKRFIAMLESAAAELDTR